MRCSIGPVPSDLLPVSFIDPSDSSQVFIQMKLLTYMDRVLTHCPRLSEPILTAWYSLLGEDLAENSLEHISALLPHDQREVFENSFRDVDETWELGRLTWHVLKKSSADIRRQMVDLARGLIKSRLRGLSYPGTSTVANNFLQFKKLFNLNDTEIELCIFLFMMSMWESVEEMFRRHLACTSYPGRKWLHVVLDCPASDVEHAINGRLGRFGILIKDPRGNIELEESFVHLLQGLGTVDIRSEFFKQIIPDPVALEAHTIESSLTNHVLDELNHRPESSTHILLYGPPGTGKTSYAYGLGRKLGLTIYLVEHGDKEDQTHRRAAISATVNVASHDGGSLIVADDCDMMLSTRDSWSLYGERCDKKWLHDILEIPNVRMVWIVNSIAHLEESVARRFSFSIEFRPFSHRQRFLIWHNILRSYKASTLLEDSDIDELARKFPTNAGVIEQVVRKTVESQRLWSGDPKRSLILALQSHERLMQGGHKPIITDSTDSNYSLEGLHVCGHDPSTVLEELAEFDRRIRSSPTDQAISVSLLMHGPSGSGKSAFARYLAFRLDREIVCYRASDLFSKWVGETEQNIRKAYAEAQAREAVLIFDEADSLIFCRDQAVYSWEWSFTNEFLNWMEYFRGIQIFTTNRLRELDGASLRRFNYKVEFGYLKPEGNLIFYQRLLESLLDERADPKTLLALKKLSSLTPGDFKLVRDRFVFKNKHDISHAAMILALKQEMKLKALHAGTKNIGFKCTSCSDETDLGTELSK